MTDETPQHVFANHFFHQLHEMVKAATLAKDVLEFENGDESDLLKKKANVQKYMVEYTQCFIDNAFFLYKVIGYNTPVTLFLIMMRDRKWKDYSEEDSLAYQKFRNMLALDLKSLQTLACEQMVELNMAMAKLIELLEGVRSEDHREIGNIQLFVRKISNYVADHVFWFDNQEIRENKRDLRAIIHKLNCDYCAYRLRPQVTVPYWRARNMHFGVSVHKTLVTASYQFLLELKETALRTINKLNEKMELDKCNKIEDFCNKFEAFLAKKHYKLLRSLRLSHRDAKRVMNATRNQNNILARHHARNNDEMEENSKDLKKFVLRKTVEIEKLHNRTTNREIRANRDELNKFPVELQPLFSKFVFALCDFLQNESSLLAQRTQNVQRIHKYSWDQGKPRKISSMHKRGKEIEQKKRKKSAKSQKTSEQSQQKKKKRISKKGFLKARKTITLIQRRRFDERQVDHVVRIYHSDQVLLNFITDRFEIINEAFDIFDTFRRIAPEWLMRAIIGNDQ